MSAASKADPAGPLPPEGSVAIVGASLAGLRAAEALRAEGHQGPVSLIGDELHLPYDRPPLSKQVLAGKWPPERAMLADRGKLDELRLDLVLGRPATAFDATDRRVTLADGTVIDADRVLLATGARPRRLPGTEGAPGLHVLRTIDDSLSLRAEVLGAGSPCRVVVIGAGFIGSEVASTCAELGCSVTVVEALATPLAPALGVLIGGACAQLHAEHGVELRTGVGVAAVHRPNDAAGEPSGRAGRVELSDGTSIPADVVVVGIGVQPNVEWLENSGLSIDNGVVCDATLSAADGVAAAGDLARFESRFDGTSQLVRIEHWQLAAEMGVHAARTLMAGRERAPDFQTVPYFWSDQYGIRIQVLGHPDPDDEVEIVEGSLAEGRFVALYGRSGRLAAALAISRPRQLMAFRPLLAEGASLDQARSVLSP